MTTPQPLTGPDIRRLIDELVTRLPAGGRQHVVVLVGGSLLAWLGLRSSTFDVDSGSRLDSELVDAAREVAHAHDLDPAWLNSAAAAFLPHGFDLRQCEVLTDDPRLRVVAPPLRIIFLMKLYRADPNDRRDLVTLWPHTGWDNPTQAAQAFHDAYPHVEDDPHLAEFLASVAATASGR